MSLSLDFMHWIDRYLGGLVVSALQPFNLRRYRVPPPAVEALDPEKVLVVKFWGIGSIALAGQTLVALKKRYPRAEFHFLTLESNRPFLHYVPVVDEVISLDIRGGGPRVFFRILRLLLSLRRRGYDLVVDLEFFTRFSALVSFMTGAPVRVGFHAWEVWRGNLANVDVPFNRYWHVTQNFFNLGRAAGVVEEEPPAFRLNPEEKDRSEAAAALEEAGIRESEKILLINPNAGEMALERRWPPGNFAALAVELTRENQEDPGLRPVFIGAPGERDYVEAAVNQAGPAAVNLAGKISIGGLLALFERAEGLVTNDSGPLQLALCQGLPTVSFFGPETPVLYGPKGGQHRVLFQHLACSPCINVHSQKKVRCVHGRPICLETIDVQRTAAEVRALLRGEDGPMWGVHG